MKIYTKTGDKGTTSLFGGKRVSKSESRISAYGTVDELNASIGVILSENVDVQTKEILIKVQNQLFTLGSDLATPLNESKIRIELPRVKKEMTLFLEKSIDKIESGLPELKNFILPGGIKSAALLHFSRTVCRRAERNVVELMAREQINTEIVKYLNRLSDLLFSLARYENMVNDEPEEEWYP